MSGLQVVAQIAGRGIDVELEVGTGRTLALVGPNAAGKSSILQVVAGLLVPDVGLVRLGERVLTDTGARIRVPVHRRRIGWLAQDGLLFGHLSVRDNVAFGPRSTGATRRDSRRVADKWLARLGTSDLATRRPGSLSGGQAQRVALARTLACDPGALLLDEPTSALDVHVAAGLRSVLAEALTERTAILVSHDLLDIVALADEVAVIESGRITQRGTVHEVLSHPVSPFAARLADVNVVRGRLASNDELVGQGLRVFGAPGDANSGEGAGLARFRSAAVTLALREPATSARNVWAGVVTEMVTMPYGIRVWVRVRETRITSDITAAAAAELSLAPGVSVFCVVKAQEVTLTSL